MENRNCEICGRGPLSDAATDAVSCCGPCGRSFHGYCADLNRITVASLYSNVGLFWFCERCRMDSPRASGTRKRSASPVTVEVFQKLAKRMDSMDENLRNISGILGAPKPEEPRSEVFETPPLPELPPEMWTDIFQRLSNFQLLKVRLVCHGWRGLVDGSSQLISRFTVTFPERTKLDTHYKPAHLLSVPKVILSRATITATGLWWPSFGLGLTGIKLVSCKIQMSTLHKLLKQTPNLKCLELLHTKPNGCVNSDIRLNKLETLVIDYEVTYGSDMHDLRVTCPNLKCLELSWNFSDSKKLPKTIQLVDAAQNTLEELRMRFNGDVSRELMRLDRLKLKRLVCTHIPGDIDKRLLVDFLRMHQSLQTLDTCGIIETNEITELLPNLKRLTLDISGNFGLQSVQGLHGLTLRARPAEAKIIFIGSECPNMRELSLDGFTLTDSGLQQCLGKMPNITALRLQSCKLESWSAAFKAIGSLKQLHHLTLTTITCDGLSATVSYDNLTSLRVLQLTNCKMPKEMLSTLFGLCPRLDDLRLASVSTMNDDVVCGLCEQLKRLSKLTISGKCLLTEDGVRCLRRNCRVEQIWISEN